VKCGIEGLCQFVGFRKENWLIRESVRGEKTAEVSNDRLEKWYVDVLDGQGVSGEYRISDCRIQKM
jgi:hypothetical protein